MWVERAENEQRKEPTIGKKVALAEALEGRHGATARRIKRGKFPT